MLIYKTNNICDKSVQAFVIKHLFTKFSLFSFLSYIWMQIHIQMDMISNCILQEKSIELKKVQSHSWTPIKSVRNCQQQSI